MLDLKTKKEELLEKWLFQLQDVEEKFRSELAIILDNNVSFVESHPKSCFSVEETIWLIKSTWNKVRFKEFVSIQPMSSPTSLVFYIENDQVRNSPVSALTSKLNVNYFQDCNFEYVKELYSTALAKQLEYEITKVLPKSSKEDLLDFAAIYQPGSLKNIFDYIIGPKEFINVLKKHDFDKYVELFEIPTIVNENLDDTVFAGKKCCELGTPIYAPYIFIHPVPFATNGTGTFTSRSSWFCNDSSK